MVLPHEFASAYAIFAIHAVSSKFSADIIAKSHTCTIDDPDVELRIIDNEDFTDWSHQQLAQWAASPEHFNNASSPFQPCVFVVVDEHSERDNAIVVVSLDKDDLSRIRGTVRADICFASVIPSLIEFEWNPIEEWQGRAQEFGGILRDTPIEQNESDLTEVAPPSGPNIWTTDGGLRGEQTLLLLGDETC